MKGADGKFAFSNCFEIELKTQYASLSLSIKSNVNRVNLTFTEVSRPLFRDTDWLSRSHVATCFTAMIVRSLNLKLPLNFIFIFYHHLYILKFT